jgi:hypothetical protein
MRIDFEKTIDSIEHQFVNLRAEFARVDSVLSSLNDNDLKYTQDPYIEGLEEEKKATIEWLRHVQKKYQEKRQEIAELTGITLEDK